MLFRSTVAANRTEAGKAGEAREIYQRAYSVAVQCKSPLRAEIREKTAELSSAAALERKTAQFKRALAARPSIRNRQNLIYHYLGELDSPTDALALVTDDLNKTLAANVTMAASPMSELKATHRITLAKWFESLVKNPMSTKGKVNILQRSREYYGKFLELEIGRAHV